MFLFYACLFDACSPTSRLFLNPRVNSTLRHLRAESQYKLLDSSVYPLIFLWLNKNQFSLEHSSPPCLLIEGSACCAQVLALVLSLKRWFIDVSIFYLVFEVEHTMCRQGIVAAFRCRGCTISSHDYFFFHLLLDDTDILHWSSSLQISLQSPCAQEYFLGSCLWTLSQLPKIHCNIRVGNVTILDHYPSPIVMFNILLLLFPNWACAKKKKNLDCGSDYF